MSIVDLILEAKSDFMRRRYDPPKKLYLGYIQLTELRATTEYVREFIVTENLQRSFMEMEIVGVDRTNYLAVGE